MQKIVLYFSLLLISFTAYGQKVEFELSAPTVVAVNEAFPISFELNANPDDFTAPSFENFNIIAGPTLAEGQQVSITNGKVDKTVSFSYTYILQAKATGKYTISAASVAANGKRYSTKPQQIEVINDAAATSPKSNSGKTTIAADDILVRVSVNRNSVYKGQPILATFKLYTRMPMSGVENAKYPAFNGFWAQDLNTDGYKWNRESYNGKTYDARIIREVLLYPQQAGNLHIEQFSLSVIAQIITKAQTSSNSMFDDFFGGGQDVQEVRKTVTSQPLQITVKDLPVGAPASFSGAVGRFQMNGGVDKPSLVANASGAYIIKISGTGNLPLITAPKLNFPTSFEQFNMKTAESLTSNTNGTTGYRQFEYPFIARADGSYTLDPVEFTYFDVDQSRYITLTIGAQSIDILPDSTTGAGAGIVSGINKEDLKILDKDIRFIGIGEPYLVKKGHLFFGSPFYCIVIIFIITLFCGIYFYMRKILRDQANHTLIRNRKANKIALMRLKAASNNLSAGDERAFYDEMLKALWGYMSDKLNIPVANLTKDNIREELFKRNIPANKTSVFIDIISDCEYAQYSPNSSKQMNEVYNASAEILSEMETLINKK